MSMQINREYLAAFFQTLKRQQEPYTLDVKEFKWGLKWKLVKKKGGAKLTDLEIHCPVFISLSLGKHFPLC